MVSAFPKKLPIFPAARLRSAVAFLVCITVSIVSVSSAAPVAGWDTTKIEGREYVSIASIKNFYNFAEMARSGNSIILKRGVRLADPEREKANKNKLVEVKFKIGGYDCLMNNVKFVFSHPIEAQGEKTYVSRVDLGKLIDPVLRPNFIPNAGDFRTVIIDPGHGGKDPGATNPFGTEARYNLKVSGMIKKKLEEKGYKVVMTRNSDVFLSLQERVEFANAIKEEAVYISVHFNSGGPSARGIETFTLSPPGVSHYGSDFKASDNQARNGNEHDSANIALATSVHGSLLWELGKNTLDRGIKRARFSVLSGVRHPAILLEGGFLSHPYEARLIEKEAYQMAIVNAVVKAVGKYRFAVTSKPGVPQKN